MNHFIYLIIFIVFTSCQEKRTIYFTENEIDLLANEKSIYRCANIDSLLEFGNFRLEGRYEYNFLYHSTELDLKSDNTFDYESTSCIGTGYSKGKWERIKDTIYLYSYDDLEDIYNEPKTKPQPQSEKIINNKDSGTITITVRSPDKRAIALIEKFYNRWC